MPAKPPLLLLHGALGGKDQFAGLITKLSSEFEVHTMNFPGHGGRSIQPEAFTIHAFGRDVLVYLNEKRLEKPNVFGFSMGGYIALWLARFHPTRIGRIMTLGTKFAWTPESAEKEKAMLNPDIILEKVPKFAEMLKNRHAPEDWRTILHKTSGLMEGLGNGEGLKQDDFEAIEHQVQVCVGSEDTMVTRLETQQVAGYLPNGSFHLFQNFTHPIERADKELLAESICGFMK